MKISLELLKQSAKGLIDVMNQQPVLSSVERIRRAKGAKIPVGNDSGDYVIIKEGLPKIPDALKLVYQLKSGGVPIILEIGSQNTRTILYFRSETPLERYNPFTSDFEGNFIHGKALGEYSIGTVTSELSNLLAEE